MFGSTLFSSVCLRYTVLLRKSNSEVKRDVGGVIKKLNKENKSLFGKLLETRSQKVKREARKGPALPRCTEPQSSPVKSETASEAWWYMQTMPRSCVIRLKGNSNTSSEVEIDKCAKHVEHTSKVSQKQCISDSFVKCQVEADQNSTSLLSVECSASESCSNRDVGISTIHVTDVLEKTYKKSSVLELPDVIIRNIPNFPLLNESKDIEQTTPTGSILNMSSSTKQFDTRKDCILYPSVGKILNATMSDSSRAALKKWRQKMISELGEEGFLNHYRGLLDRGIQFHDAIKNHLSGAPESDLKLDQIQGCWQSLTAVITDVTDVQVLESHVVHSSLLYRGVIDCLACYKGKPVVIEWKKSDKQKPEIEKTYDAPLQLSAYFGAMNYDVNYNYQVQGGLVVVAYSDGSPAHTFRMSMTDCKKYWSMWLLRLQQYWLQQQQQELQQPAVQ